VLGFVDVPGHEKLIHNMLAGATGIDFVLLVIAADDGPDAADARAPGTA
jgi:selenocysteine-specific elongation factor